VSRTNQQRFDEAVNYLQSVNLSLSQDVKNKTQDQKKAGEQISLEGFSYWKSGSDEQHRAVRALLLCMITYMKPPHSPTDLVPDDVMDDFRRQYRGKTISDLNEEILYFVPESNLSLRRLVNAALEVKTVDGVIDPPVRSRKDKNVGKAPVCYHGVRAWLYAAGFVSKRWMAKEGQTLMASTSNAVVGRGVIVEKKNWDKIPAGYIWNIHKNGDEETCHWGVSLGENRAVACNNTPGSPGGALLDMEPGGTLDYAIFKMTNMCEVLNTNSKYQQHGGKDHPSGQNIIVRKINPLLQFQYY
jgi:hypothetical protein